MSSCDLAAIYCELCEKRSLRPAPQLRDLLKGRTELRMLELDLRKVYLPPKQVGVLADICSLCSNLTALNVSDSQLGNDAACALAAALTEHPAVTELDVSGNSLSLPAGKALLALATDNPNITAVGCAGCGLSELWVERIAVQTDLNGAREGAVKDLCCDDGEIDGGVGRPAQRARRELGMPPPQGDEDEEWEWSSNLADAEDWQRRADRLGDELRAEAEGREAGGVEGPLDDHVAPEAELPRFEPAETVTQDAVQKGEDGALLNPCPLRRQSIEQIAAGLFDTDRLWTDPAFPPCPESLCSAAGRNERQRRTKGLRWERAGFLVPKGELFADPQRPSIPVQGALADAWLCSAAALLCARRPGLICQLFGAAHPDIGCYEVRVCKSGRWFDVVIDDWVPVDETGHFAFMRNADPSELWAALMEKAWAKLHGGYDRLERGSSTMALADLSGGTAHAIRIRSHARAKEVVADGSYWATLRGYSIDGWLMGAAAKARGGVESASLRQLGIEPNILYEVTDFAELTQWKLVQLLAPGDVPDADTEQDLDSAWLGTHWLERLGDDDYRRMYGHFGQVQRHPGGALRWMTFENFAIYFNKVHILRLHADPSARVRQVSQRVVGEWRGQQAGGRLREQYFTENPCWCLRVKEKDTPVLLQLSQPDARLARGARSMDYVHKIGLYVIKAASGDRKKRCWRREDVVVAPRFVPHRETITEVLCQPLVHYLLVPATEQGGVEKAFALHCTAPGPFALTEVPSARDAEIKLAGAWSGATAGGRPSGSTSWVLNPQFQLKVLEAGMVSVLLHQLPKERGPYYIAFYVFRGGLRVEEYRSADVVLYTDFGPYKTVVDEVELPAGDYTVIPMTWARGEEGCFELSFITRSRVKVSPIRSLIATAQP